MTGRIDRRKFLLASGAGLASARLLAASVAMPRVPPRKYLRAVKLNMVQGELSLLEKFQLLERLRYDGVELDSPNAFSDEEVLAARRATKLRIHGVIDSVHWRKTLSDPDAKVRAEGIAGLTRALHDAKTYGASTVLLVPAVVSKRVSYKSAYERSQAAIREVLPLAAELEIKIAIENVWNKFLLSPLEMARYIDEFDSPWIGSYLDVGNLVTYGWPEHWIEVLGERILKVDVKGFSRKKQNETGPYSGFKVEILAGDCDWKAVMKALQAVGYEGWFTAEVPGGDEKRLRDIGKRLQGIFRLG